MAIRLGKYRISFQAIGIILLFIFGVAPILLSVVPNVQYNEAFSIYNTGYDGLSEVRTALEGTGNYNITTTVSNLNALNRFNGSGVLVIVGPTASFDQTEFISLLLFLLRGGSLIIADDFGTGNQILAPLFDAFNGYDSFAKNAQNITGIPIPTIGSILQNATGGGSSGSSSGSSGGSLAGGVVDQSSLISSVVELIGTTIKRFGFNGSVLMDVGSNDGNPNRPTITDYDKTGGKYSITNGLTKPIQTEMATSISVKVNVSETVPDGNGGLKDVYVQKWEPLTRVTFAEITGNNNAGDTVFKYLDFLFPLYSSKFSWMETDRKGAADNTAVPNAETEWGDRAFSLALNLPIIPGGGKIVFIADPSIFINRYTQDTQYDNKQFVLNLIEMAANNLQGPGIPVIFDFGHTYQGLTSPTLYSTVLLKLIANMSMFPLVAPFVPLTAYSFGKKLIPENRRLRPMLLTKRRGGAGNSNFEKELEEIKEFGLYGKPIKSLTSRVKRLVRKDVRYEGSQLASSEEVANFFYATFPGRFNRRELRSNLKKIYKISVNPERPMSIIMAKPILVLLKELVSLLQ